MSRRPTSRRDVTSRHPACFTPEAPPACGRKAPRRHGPARPATHPPSAATRPRHAGDPHASTTRERQPIDGAREQLGGVVGAARQRRRAAARGPRRPAPGPRPSARPAPLRAPSRGDAASRRRGRTDRGARARASPDTPRAAGRCTRIRRRGRHGPRTGTCSSSRRAESGRGRSHGRPCAQRRRHRPRSVAGGIRGRSVGTRAARRAAARRDARARPLPAAASGRLRRSPGADVPWWGARNGGTVTSGLPCGSRPATEWIRVTSSASRACQRREDPGKAAREHRLPGAGRPGEQQVVRPRGGDLERPSRTLLPTHVGEVGPALAAEIIVGKRLELRRLDLAAQVRDRLCEVTDRHRLDAGERRLGRRLRSANDAAKARPPRALGDGERPRDRPDPPVERELADRRVVGEALGRKLAGRGEHRERDGQVEARALLAQRRGREVDGDPPVERPLERRGDDTASDAVLRFLARAVGEADDREPRHAGLEMRLDLDTTRLEADESVGHRTCQHPTTVGAKASREATPSRQERYRWTATTRGSRARTP